MKPPRICKECSGIIPAGSGRCPCKSVRIRTYDRKACADSSLEAAHFYHWIKAIRSGEWARTGYRPPRNPDREYSTWLYKKLEGSYTITRLRPYFSITRVEHFIYRCELSEHYWRSEFDGLMARRLTLWLAGYTQQKTADHLQLPLEQMRWLDSEIRKFGLYLPPRHRGQHAGYGKAYRKMKAGVAQDILRRRQKGYKQGQTLSYEWVNPFSEKLSATSEEKNHAEKTETETRNQDERT